MKKIKMKGPNGDVITVPEEQVSDKLAEGYTVVNGNGNRASGGRKVEVKTIPSFKTQSTDAGVFIPNEELSAEEKDQYIIASEFATHGRVVVTPESPFKPKEGIVRNDNSEMTGVHNRLNHPDNVHDRRGLHAIRKFGEIIAYDSDVQPMVEREIMRGVVASDGKCIVNTDNTPLKSVDLLPYLLIFSSKGAKGLVDYICLDVKKKVGAIYDADEAAKVTNIIGAEAAEKYAKLEVEKLKAYQVSNSNSDNPFTFDVERQGAVEAFTRQLAWSIEEMLLAYRGIKAFINNYCEERFYYGTAQNDAFAKQIHDNLDPIFIMDGKSNVAKLTNAGQLIKSARIYLRNYLDILEKNIIKLLNGGYGIVINACSAWAKKEIADIITAKVKKIDDASAPIMDTSIAHIRHFGYGSNFTHVMNADWNGKVGSGSNLNKVPTGVGNGETTYTVASMTTSGNFTDMIPLVDPILDGINDGMGEKLRSVGIDWSKYNNTMYVYPTFGPHDVRYAFLIARFSMNIVKIIEKRFGEFVKYMEANKAVLPNYGLFSIKSIPTCVSEGVDNFESESTPVYSVDIEKNLRFTYPEVAYHIGMEGDKSIYAYHDEIFANPNSIKKVDDKYIATLKFGCPHGWTPDGFMRYLRQVDPIIYWSTDSDIYVAKDVFNASKGVKVKEYRINLDDVTMGDVLTSPRTYGVITPIPAGLFRYHGHLSVLPTKVYSDYISAKFKNPIANGTYEHDAEGHITNADTVSSFTPQMSTWYGEFPVSIDKFKAMKVGFMNSFVVNPDDSVKVITDDGSGYYIKEAAIEHGYVSGGKLKESALSWLFDASGTPKYTILRLTNFPTISGSELVVEDVYERVERWATWARGIYMFSNPFTGARGDRTALSADKSMRVAFTPHMYIFGEGWFTENVNIIDIIKENYDMRSKIDAGYKIDPIEGLRFK
jgi:hypothetical protein